MSVSEDLIDFEIIENQKENIQSLPGGRSARTLANLFSPSPLHSLSTPTPSDSKNLNDAIRKEYEAELVNISESDDPLDIYDRYVRWTLDAYPSAQATPASQLLPLLERATKTFLTSAQYKNDPRYLKLWISYIRFFSETPRETFAFLARHNIGEGLALFYEEFAAWLEGAGRWTQAEEVYKLGIDREARPTARLLRKFNEFQQRFEQRPRDGNEPSSPALPTVRPALAAKIDPFAPAAPSDSQALRPNSGVGGSMTKNGRQKLMIFSDGDDAAPALASGEGTNGWESIGSLAERKKENVMEPKPWVGETLKAGGKKSSTKMAVFKDEVGDFLFAPYHANVDDHRTNDWRLWRFVFQFLPQIKNPQMTQVSVNPKNGRSERIHVNLEAVYPTPDIIGTELSFEELRASQRGWLSKVWQSESRLRKQVELDSKNSIIESNISLVTMSREVSEKLVIPRDTVILDENGVAKDGREGRPRRMKIKEVNETQIIKAKLSSPSGPKITKRKASKDATMTLHTRAATDEIYDLFSQPLKSAADEDEEQDSDDDDGDMTDGDYTSGGESTGTGRLGTISEVGDDETSEVKSVSEWSEFTARKHVPNIDDDELEDTQASHFTDDVDEDFDRIKVEVDRPSEHGDKDPDELATPVSPRALSTARTMFVPIPPEDYVPPMHPYRDLEQVSQNRLPFMTPIAEKTESSLGIQTIREEKDYFNSKTPSKENGSRKPPVRLDDLGSSPFAEIINEAKPSAKIAQPMLSKTLKTNKTTVIAAKVQASGGTLAKEIAPKGPIVKDAQCNPVDDYTRSLIFENLQPPLSTYEGFFDHKDETRNRSTEIRKFVKAVAKMNKNASDKTTTNLATPPVLAFPGTDRQYTVKRELGAGAFAPVYLVESVADENEDDGESNAVMGKGAFDHLGRQSFEALKMEDPPTAWEFYIMRQAKRRLGISRAVESLIDVYEMHLYQDECYLIEEYRDQGTLLDIINIARADSKASGGVMDETLVMFFAIELFRTIEALHSKGILHGDLKADNCLVRFDTIPNSDVWSTRYRKDGTGCWNKKGVALIDFGRGIDMKVFRPDVQFIADWKTGPQDCAELRELRPWTYQIDYHGLAGIIHCMLFGKYIDTIADKGSDLGAAAKKHWRIKENLKRYWQGEIWNEVFELLLNPGLHVEGEEGTKLPVLKRAITAAAFKAESYYDRIRVFERRETAGGTWIHDSSPKTDLPLKVGALPPAIDPPLEIPNDLPKITSPNEQERFAQTPIYDSLTTNVPDIAMCFSDIPFPYGPFVPHYIPRQYVESYVSAHNLNEHLQLNTTVEDVSKLPSTTSSKQNKWKITLRKHDSTRHIDLWWEEIFDAVPEVEGLAEYMKIFPGRISHSKTYRSPHLYTNKKVVIIGNSASGHDLSTELVSTASLPVYQSRRSASRWDGDTPPPGIAWLPIIQKFLPSGRIVFDDDTYLDDVDAVIYCTGYLPSYPFWNEKNGRPLWDYANRRMAGGYQHTFFKDLPNVAIVGLPRVLTFRSFEYQAIALARLWSARNWGDLPDVKEMERWERDREVVRRREGKKFHDIDYETGETLEWLGFFYRIAGLGKLTGEGRVPPVLGKEVRWALEHLRKYPEPGRGEEEEKVDGWVVVERNRRKDLLAFI
ncbi:hypothetical protein B7494_g2385 [Chlorociboria aeruginascens]|nr:hypothetical protein B7494_g2385 [Chlorociboria aeruginascens]